MSRRIFVASRKGLFIVEKKSSGWAIAQASFLGDQLTMVLPDARDGAVYVAIGHGHFGVKLHRSDDGGATFKPCATPAYPPKPEGVDDREASRGTPIPWN